MPCQRRFAVASVVVVFVCACFTGSSRAETNLVASKKVKAVPTAVTRARDREAPTTRSDDLLELERARRAIRAERLDHEVRRTIQAANRGEIAWSLNDT